MLEISVFWGHLLKVRVLYGMLTVETPQLSSELEKKHSAVSQNLIFFLNQSSPLSSPWLGLSVNTQIIYSLILNKILENSS